MGRKKTEGSAFTFVGERVASSLVKTYLARNASLIDRDANCAL